VEPDARIGRELGGRYRIVERLASGAMGVVYRSERVGLGRPVAIKFLHGWIAAQPDRIRRFETEARAASRLSHPNCAAVIDFGVDDGAPYLVMELMTGATLRALIDKSPVAPARGVAIARQVLAGLAHAHAHGIVHRDVKPANIILDDATGVGDHARIVDFGLAKLTDGSSTATTGFALGTPAYMAPEQTLGDPVDGRTDVYAVGVVLYELLTGQKPFAADSAAELFRLHREAPIPRLPGVSPALEAAVVKALAKRPADRHADARAFAAALAATPEAGPDARPAPRRRAASFFAAALAGLAIGATVLAWPRARPRAPALAATPDAPPPLEIALPVAEPTGAALARPDEATIPQLVARLKRNPQDARTAFQLGHVYFARLWWNDGLQAYELAIAIDPSLRTDPIFIRDLVHALVSDSFHERAAAVLVGIGASALPFLEEAARTDPTINVRRRAAALAERLR
jgi:serine/threonine-protein kinase